MLPLDRGAWLFALIRVWFPNVVKMTVRDGLSATENGHQLRANLLNGGNKLLGKGQGNRSDEESNNDSRLVEPSPKPHNAVTTPVMQAMANT